MTLTIHHLFTYLNHKQDCWQWGILSNKTTKHVRAKYGNMAYYTVGYTVLKMSDSAHRWVLWNGGNWRSCTAQLWVKKANIIVSSFTALSHATLLIQKCRQRKWLMWHTYRHNIYRAEWGFGEITKERGGGRYMRSDCRELRPLDKC